ncbi:MAG: hypothetical protein FWG65_09775 [Turicibacter sp.]|nr:hypothetical protein [Turicibacter sp.]
MAQLNYTYQTQLGVAGGLLDVSPYSVNSRTFSPNEEDETRSLKFGTGVVVGASPGTTVTAPRSDTTASDFEGLVLTGFTTEHNLTGDLKLHPGATVGVLRFGKAWARLEPDIEPKYGDRVYLIKEGEFVGCFTNLEDGNLPLAAQFVGNEGLVAAAGSIAPIEIFN